MMNRRPVYLASKLTRIWALVCCIPLLFFAVLPSAAWALSTPDGGDPAVYAELRAGKRVESDKSYVTPEKPTVYLTFDDGPSRLTPTVLDILKEEDVKATFFVLGQQVEAQPELAQRIVREGHSIGNHSYNHVYNQLYSDFKAFWEQIQHTEQVVENATGVKPRLLRAPGGTFGNFDAFYFYYLDQAGYEVFDWNIDSGDSARVGVPAKEIYQTVEKGPFRHEVVLLMHDSLGHSETLKALPQIIKLFKDKGYDFAAMTPQVKPIHFSAGKLKWPRAVTRQSFDQFSIAAMEHEAVWTDNAADAAAPEAGITKEAPPTAIAAMSELNGGASGPERLSIKTEERSLELAKGAFRFRDEAFTVPLRQLSEGMGASVEWLAEQRTARVNYGLYTAEYDLGKRELRIQRPANVFVKPEKSVTTISLPDMELKDGTIYVPLRKTIEMLGNLVGGYQAEKEPGTAEVRLMLRGVFGHGFGLDIGRAF